MIIDYGLNSSNYIRDASVLQNGWISIKTLPLNVFKYVFLDCLLIFITSRQLLPPWPRPAIMLALLCTQHMSRYLSIWWSSASNYSPSHDFETSPNPSKNCPYCNLHVDIFYIYRHRRAKEVDPEQCMRGPLPHGHHRNKMHSHRDRHFLVFSLSLGIFLHLWEGATGGRMGKAGWCSKWHVSVLCSILNFSPFSHLKLWSF